MLANRVSDLPPGEGWVFEPKWDGFRALIFRDGDETFIQSRDEKPLDRYFPELLGADQGAAAGALRARRRDRDRGRRTDSTSRRFSFACIPAASRVKMLSGEIPASIVFFDLLCEGDAIFAARRSASGARGSSRCSRTRRRRCTDAGDARPGHRRRLVSSLRGRGPRRRRRQAGERASTSRTSASCSR